MEHAKHHITSQHETPRNTNPHYSTLNSTKHHTTEHYTTLAHQQAARPRSSNTISIGEWLLICVLLVGCGLCLFTVVIPLVFRMWWVMLIVFHPRNSLMSRIIYWIAKTPSLGTRARGTGERGTRHGKEGKGRKGMRWYVSCHVMSCHLVT